MGTPKLNLTTQNFKIIEDGVVDENLEIKNLNTAVEGSSIATETDTGNPTFLADAHIYLAPGLAAPRTYFGIGIPEGYNYRVELDFAIQLRDPGAFSLGGVARLNRRLFTDNLKVFIGGGVGGLLPDDLNDQSEGLWLTAEAGFKYSLGDFDLGFMAGVDQYIQDESRLQPAKNGVRYNFIAGYRVYEW